MKTESLSLIVSPDVGSVSAEYIIPEKSNCIMTLAHGAGAGMNHPFMVSLAKTLAEIGIATLRFNFPFIEHKKRRPDVPAVAHKTIEAAIFHARELFPLLPLFVSGKSFGGRMTSQYLSIHPHSLVRGIIFYGFPLHPLGKPSVERADHLKNVKVPMLFLQGTRDALATLGLITSVCSSLSNATLIKIEGADHAFKAGKQNTVELLAKSTGKWIGNAIE
ncbi:alpha/beta family hydrolase [Segetibacter koreensis]|uniref:alpha/beta hydrolase family protein n=1 Tax=Segetibacter koreensis TaxID=398037 RepID=UPI0004772606|nr:alpha/beta family hydrolase [Segetibacter koreensis]